MAEEVLVTEYLSKEMIEAGLNLLKQLDKNNLDIRKAFWLYNSDEKRWKLVIISDLVDKEGPKFFYNKVIEVNNRLTDTTVSLNDIEAAGDNHKIAKLLGIIIGGTNKSFIGARLSKNTINGVFIEDVYMYR